MVIDRVETVTAARTVKVEEFERAEGGAALLAVGDGTLAVGQARREGLAAAVTALGFHFRFLIFDWGGG